MTDDTHLEDTREQEDLDCAQDMKDKKYEDDLEYGDILYDEGKE
jgi:hypothetical protein